jgi:hypothetical protein
MAQAPCAAPRHLKINGLFATLSLYGESAWTLSITVWSAIMPSVAIFIDKLGVVMLSVIMMSVVAPHVSIRMVGQAG